MPSENANLVAQARRGMSFTRLTQIYGVSEPAAAAQCSRAAGLPTASPAPWRELEERRKCPLFFEMPIEAQDIALDAKIETQVSLDAIFKNNTIPAAAEARRLMFYGLAEQLGWTVSEIASSTAFSNACIRAAIKEHCSKNSLPLPASFMQKTGRRPQ